MVFSDTQKLLSFMRFHLLVFGLNAYFIDVLFKKKILLYTFEFKPISHVLFYHIQNIWTYVEVRDPFLVEFCRTQ